MLKKLAALLMGMALMGAAPYDNLPQTIPSLRSWYDFSNASTVTESGGNVTQITDLAVGAATLSQSTAGDRPAYTIGGLNGLNVATFTGGYKFMKTAALVGSNYYPSMSVIGVVRTNNVTANQIWLSIITPGFGSPYLLMQSFANNWQAQYPSNAAQAVRTNSLNASVISAVGSVSGTQTLWVNGTAGTTEETTSVTFPNDIMALGSPDGATPFDGIIGEVVMYTTALSTENRQRIEGYMACKWGLQASLPATHPFRNICPYFPNPFTLGG